MTFISIQSIPVLTDNYIHMMITNSSAIVIDPAESAPVMSFLNENHLNLTHILLTHHHADHTGGVKELKGQFPNCQVIGFADDAHRLPRLDKQVSEGDRLSISGLTFEVRHLPGHTMGHIAFIEENLKVTFSGDVLFGMGCGRVFEGTYEEMFHSLQRLKSLAPEMKIYCTHEYTINNGKFATTILPDSQEIKARLERSIQLRAQGAFTVPLLLKEELNTNPFLVAKDLEDFSKYRDARNRF